MGMKGGGRQVGRIRLKKVKIIVDDELYIYKSYCFLLLTLLPEG